MEFAISTLLGYLLGSISPAALIAKIKKVNLRKSGTGNLGATNTTLVFGKKFGIAVMAFDIFKSALAVIIVRLIFSEVGALAGLIAGASAVVGHMFPFYMKFKGGKGLAAYGGMVLAFDPLLFLILLCLGIISMIIINYGVALTYAAAIFFPVLVGFKYWSSPFILPLILVASAISILLMVKHIDNIFKAIRKQDYTMRQFLKKVFSKSFKSEASQKKD